MSLQQNKISRILCIYSASQTFTQTVFEHLDSFQKYSKYCWSYIDINHFNDNSSLVLNYDVVVLHYSVRLPFSEIKNKGLADLRAFNGIKVLFIQDEYDNAGLVRTTINYVSFDLVFTVVPPNSIEAIYPSKLFYKTKFVNNLTGYVPENIVTQVADIPPPSTRSLTIAYRGRPLPIRYGKMGQDKIAVGYHVKNYCKVEGISCDIEWDEQSRIYGEKWYEFIISSKAMLGSESGSNVYDWAGTLQRSIESYRNDNPSATDQEIYNDLICSHEIDGLMNQISPRIFEMAAAKTVMVLFEGMYSNIIAPNKHYLPLKKDFSNLQYIFTKLSDNNYIDRMANIAYDDLIVSGNYSYREFIRMVDNEIADLLKRINFSNAALGTNYPSKPLYITDKPIKTVLPSVVPSPIDIIDPRTLSAISNTKFTNGIIFINQYSAIKRINKLLVLLWRRLPLRIRPTLKKILPQKIIHIIHQTLN